MERYSDEAIRIIDELHTERLDYQSEYIPLIDAAQRLDAYEATGVEPENICTLQEELNQYKELGDLHRLRELVQADREGRCVVLPFSVGTCVYVAAKSYTGGPDAIIPQRIRDIHDAVYYLPFWMKNVFPDEKSAEKALREMEANGNG